MRHLMLAMVILFGSLPVVALDSDRDQPINILADAAVVDDNSGITIYTGSVEITQGTLLITADEVRVIMSNQEVVQIIANMAAETAALAHYQQLPENEKDLVSADARMITYFIQEERLHLAGNARLKQTRDRFSGELIHYDMAKGVAEIKGQGKNADGEKRRVNIQIQPQSSKNPSNN